MHHQCKYDHMLIQQKLNFLVIMTKPLQYMISVLLKSYSGTIKSLQKQNIHKLFDFTNYIITTYSSYYNNIPEYFFFFNTTVADMGALPSITMHVNNNFYKEVVLNAAEIKLHL